MLCILFIKKSLISNFNLHIDLAITLTFTLCCIEKRLYGLLYDTCSYIALRFIDNKLFNIQTGNKLFHEQSYNKLFNK
jgi:hypothetical protein